MKTMKAKKNAAILTERQKDEIANLLVAHRMVEGPADFQEAPTIQAAFEYVRNLIKKDRKRRKSLTEMKNTALVTNHVADENGQLVEAGQIEVVLDPGPDTNVTEDNWPLTPMERADNSERDAEALTVISQWSDGAITYSEMVRLLEAKITVAEHAATCVRCLGPMGQFKSSCCMELVCAQCDSKCPKCGKSVFNKEND